MDFYVTVRNRDSEGRPTAVEYSSEYNLGSPETAKSLTPVFHAILAAKGSDSKYGIVDNKKSLTRDERSALEALTTLMNGIGSLAHSARKLARQG